MIASNKPIAKPATDTSDGWLQRELAATSTVELIKLLSEASVSGLLERADALLQISAFTAQYQVIEQRHTGG